ncbi:MAG: NAD-dependent epimerase/dehydratase family protein [Candidatus Hodarchaeales archaeon]
MKILLTGGTGFVGSHIMDALEHKYDPKELIMFVRDKKKAIERTKKGVSVVEGDITRFQEVKKVILEYKPKVIIHAAALADDWAPLEKLMEVNAKGTLNIIKAMENIPNIFLIHVSSSGVYPRIEGVYIKEETQYGPHGNYQRSKVEAEKYVRRAVENGTIKGAIIRPPNVMGTRDYTHMTKIVRAIRKGKFPLVRKGKARQTWVAAEDLALAVLLLIENQNKVNGNIYNVKSFEISVKNLLDLVCRELGVSSPSKEYPYWLAYTVGFLSEILAKIKGKPTTLNRYRVIKFAKDRLFDDSKIRQELGYDPQVTAEVAIKKTITWIKENNL